MLFSDLFRMGQFNVPWHQRNYDWESSAVRVLLDDIGDAIEETRKGYFLGTIMLVGSETNQWEINDGQQRMVTISLIIAELCRGFANRQSGSRLEGLALEMLFDLSRNNTSTWGEMEERSPRITPPQNDVMRYRQMILGNTIGTNGKLTVAWREIAQFLSPMNHQQLKQYFEFILNNLEVVCLRIPPAIDANTVYETINCRGKKLDDLDLIRNYLYSHFNTTGNSEKKDVLHQNLEKIRTYFSSSTKASQYMRCHLQCRFGFLRKDDFYLDVRKVIRAKEKNPKQQLSDYVFRLTQEIASNELLRLFQVISAPSPDQEFIDRFKTDSRTTNSLRNLEVFLRELHEYTIAQPLIFAILTKYILEKDAHKRKQIAKIANKHLRRLTTFVMRTAFVSQKFSPSLFEKKFSNLANRITFSDNIIPEEEFIQFLKECDNDFNMMSDSNFLNIIAEAKMTGNQKIKQFLLGINKALQSDASIINERRCSVEHILPKSPTHRSNWIHFKDNGSDWIHRIGNLTVMGQTDNKPGLKYNGKFAEKRRVYQESGIKLTKQLGQNTEWTPESIESRQKMMAELAVRVWSFN